MISKVTDVHHPRRTWCKRLPRFEKRSAKLPQCSVRPSPEKKNVLRSTNLWAGEDRSIKAKHEAANAARGPLAAELTSRPKEILERDWGYRFLAFFPFFLNPETLFLTLHGVRKKRRENGVSEKNKCEPTFITHTVQRSERNRSQEIENTCSKPPTPKSGDLKALFCARVRTLCYLLAPGRPQMEGWWVRNCC